MSSPSPTQTDTARTERTFFGHPWGLANLAGVAMYWDAGRYVAHRQQTLTLQFRTVKGRYTHVGTARTIDRGHVTRAVKATVDGCYRWSYTGTATTARVTTKGDCIDVR